MNDTQPNIDDAWRALPSHLFLLSEDSRPKLIEACHRLRSSHSDDRSMSSLASCLGRNNFRAHRLGVLATNREELETQLSSALAFLAEGSYHFRTPTGLYYGSGPGPLGVVGMFPGLGSTYSGMIDELSQISPVTRRWFTVYGDSLSRIRRVCRVRPDELVHAEYSIPVEPRLLDDDAHSALIASLALHDLCLIL